MSRIVVGLLLSVAVLWQSLPFARFGLSQAAVSSGAHFAVHWADEAHHHHDDGSFHVDESTDSADHLAADHFNPSGTEPPNGAVASARRFSSSPSAVIAPSIPQPFLDAPLRPPRLSV